MFSTLFYIYKMKSIYHRSYLISCVNLMFYGCFAVTVIVACHILIQIDFEFN